MNQMEEQYFDEKKELAISYLEEAGQYLEEALDLIYETRYTMPNIVPPASVHEAIESITFRLRRARTNFEKARWSAAKTNIEFQQWLVENGCRDLIQSTPPTEQAFGGEAP